MGGGGKGGKDGTISVLSDIQPLIAKFELPDSDRVEIKKNWAPSTTKVGGHDHSHDVKALTIAGDFLVSGGIPFTGGLDILCVEFYYFHSKTI